MEPPCPSESTITTGHRESKAERKSRLARERARKYRQRHRQKVRERNRRWHRDHNQRSRQMSRDARERRSQRQQAADERRSHRTHRTPEEAARLDLLTHSTVVSQAELRRPTFITVSPDGRRTRETLDATVATPPSTTPPKSAT